MQSPVCPPSPSAPLPPHPLCHPMLVHLGSGNSGESCVCRLFPTITFNYGSLQCGLVKGLAIRSLSLSLSLLILESGQAPCENDPNSPLLTLHAPQLTLREPAPTRKTHRHSVNSHHSLSQHSLTLFFFGGWGGRSVLLHLISSSSPPLPPHPASYLQSSFLRRLHR